MSEAAQAGARVTPLFAGRPGVAAAQEPAPASAARRAFFSAIARLEQVIDLETGSLQENRRTDLRDFNARKSHGLLELSRAMRAVDGQLADGEATRSLQALRQKLERNTEVLQRHLMAVQEVSAMMSGAIQAAESDGTYSVTDRRGDSRL